MMSQRLYHMPFADLYPLYVAKAEKKNRTQQEVDQIICWLLGYDGKAIQNQMDKKVSVQEFFDEAPRLNEKAYLVKGVICGVRIENIEEPLMRKIRYLDKLIDELAKGRPLEKILHRTE